LSTRIASHATVVDDTVYLGLGCSAVGSRSSDFALSVRTSLIWASDELYSTSSFGLDTSEILALSADD
jgi:hypothetical protein